MIKWPTTNNIQKTDLYLKLKKMNITKNNNINIKNN